MSKHFFSLIELIVVIAILALLASLVSPSIHKAYEQSRAIVCQSQLRPIFVADTNYANDSNNLIFMRNKDDNATGDGRFYWNHPRSLLRPYLDYMTLQCPSDPYVTPTEYASSYRDGISFGRNSHIDTKNTRWDDVVRPDQKLFYADSGHRYSDPVERDQATRRNLSSSNRIQGKSSWNNEGVFARHSFKEANALFFDGHAERLDNVDIDGPESINYSFDDSVLDKHWEPIDD